MGAIEHFWQTFNSGAILSFSAPPGANDYSQRVYTRVKQLVQAGFWDIPMERLVGWYSGFTGSEQTYFASCLLDSLIYRTSPQFSASLAALYRGVCGHAVAESIHLAHDMSLVTLLQGRYNDPCIRLVPVICDSDPPSKSGPLVMRRMKKDLGICEKWMIWPWQIEASIEQGVKLIILVDDLLGSGAQLEEFCEKQQLKKVTSGATVLYAPVVAHSAGIGHLKSIWPQLRVVATELLTEDHGFFSTQNWNMVSAGKISPENALDYYCEEILPLTGFNKSKTKVPELGFGKLALSYGFAHSTPNNSLPIFWWESDRWPSLLER